jgi:hypothetical protein
MTDFPPGFQFSQNNLQDYADCARRFQLRYLVGMRWPAVESEPVAEHEHFVEQGLLFHQLAQRHHLGITPARLAPRDPLLAEWWRNFLDHPPRDLPTAVRLAEIGLATPLEGERLVAQFDLLALEPGRAVIVDWKTTRRRPDRATLARRLQTRVYPFVLVEAGAHLIGSPIAPEQVGMIYWFANHPTDPETFAYDAAAHQANRDFLAGLTGEIRARDEAIWPLTEELFQCKYCIYRSLCERGVEAGPFDVEELDAEPPDDFDFDLSLDEVEEIAF